MADKDDKVKEMLNRDYSLFNNPMIDNARKALSKKDHQLLVYLHAASLNCALPPTFSFRQTEVFSGICLLLMVVSVMEYAQCFWTVTTDQDVAFIASYGSFRWYLFAGHQN